MLPLSSRVIFSMDWISCSMRWRDAPILPANSRTVSEFSGSLSRISWYIIRAANGVFSWWEISEIVDLRNSLFLCSASFLDWSIVDNCSISENSWNRSPSWF